MTDTAYTITEVSEQTGLTKHTLRYYEKIGLFGSVPRAQNGHRRYTEGKINWINYVKKLQATGMSIEHIRQYIELTKAGDFASLVAREELLAAQRDKLERHIAEAQEHLKYLEHKVDWYQNEIAYYEATGELLDKP